MKKILCVLLASVVLLFMTSGCGKKEEKSIADWGIEISLPDEFYEYDSEGRFLYSKTNGKITFGFNRVLFSSSKNINKLSCEDSAAQRIEQENKRNVLRQDIEYNEEYGYAHFQFFETDGNYTRVYFAYVYKSSDAFYFCDFTCLKEDAESCEKEIESYAKTIKPTDGKFILRDDEDKAFTSGIGISIVLNHSFSIVNNYARYGYAVSNNNVLLGVSRTLFSTEKGIEELTISEWTKRVIEENDIQAKLVTKVFYDETQNRSSFVYKEIQADKEIVIYSYIMKSNSAFYMLEFSCNEELEDDYKSLFDFWIQSVVLY